MDAQEMYALLSKRSCCFCGIRLLSIEARYTSDTATEKTKFFTCSACGTYSEYEVDDRALGSFGDLSAQGSDADPGL